jgi:hypothetical protein
MLVAALAVDELGERNGSARTGTVRDVDVPHNAGGFEHLRHHVSGLIPATPGGRRHGDGQLINCILGGRGDDSHAAGQAEHEQDDDERP